MLRISVIIRTKNEEQFLGQTLEALKSQTVQDFEIVLVDSGSTDRTLEIARRFSRMRIIEISPETFSFGYALNVGADNAKGEILVLLSAHAIPTTETFLEVYLNYFTDPTIAGVYGRQTILPEHRHLKQYLLLSKGYDETYGPDKNNRIVECFFSNANAAILKERWQECKFDESMTMVEDWAWAKQMHRRGYRTCYEPQAEVYHSHDYTFRQIYRRAWLEAQGYNLVYPEWYKKTFTELTWRVFIKVLFFSIRNDIFFSIKELKRWDVVLYAIISRLFMQLGYFQGFKKKEWT